MTKLNSNDQDSIAASEKVQDMVVEKGPRIAITSDRTAGADEEFDSNLKPLSPVEAWRAERRAQMMEGMNQSRNGGYPTMDGQRVCDSPAIAISTYVC